MNCLLIWIRARAAQIALRAAISASMLLAPLSKALSAGLDRDALWLVVRSCVLAKRTTGLAIPCLEANLGEGSDAGFVVLRPPLRPTHILVVPTDRIVGIESPVLQRPEAGAYWRAALNARRFALRAKP